MSGAAHNKTSLQGANRSALLFVLHLAVGLCAFVAARLVGSGALRLHTCVFHEMTGLYCLTCGATRASVALVRLQLRHSVLLNPVPVLLAAFWLSVVVHELRCVLSGQHHSYRGRITITVAIVAISAVFMMLRNLGVIPPPDLL